MTVWDADQYLKFRDERSRPFYDLLSRVPERPYARITDLGSGPGDLTRALADRWPSARVVGVDLSPEMLGAAARQAIPGRLDFVRGDVAEWRAPDPQDLIVSNATFQWIPDPERLLRNVVSQLAPRGVLAVQMPANFESPSQTILAELERSGPWAEALRDRPRHDKVLPLRSYLQLLAGLGLAVDAWETVYLHVLPGDDAVFEWMKGTALRPILTRLQGRLLDEFLAVYRDKMRVAFPRERHGTVYPFKRVFFVAHQPGANP